VIEERGWQESRRDLEGGTLHRILDIGGRNFEGIETTTPWKFGWGEGINDASRAGERGLA